jgi:hypothetical protein
MKKSIMGLVFLLAGLSSVSSALPPESPAEIEFIGSAQIDTFNPGVKLFLDRDFVLKDCPPLLKGASFARGSIERTAFRVVRDGVVTVLTPESNQYGSAQHGALEAEGFIRSTELGLFQLFGDIPANQVRVYRKNVKSGEQYSFKKWIVVLAASVPESPGAATALPKITGKTEGASIEFSGARETDRLTEGSVLFTDRKFVVKEVPASLRGQSFLRGSIEQLSFRVTAPGMLTLLTPDPGDKRAASQFQSLENLGFTQIDKPFTFQLFGAEPFDRVRIYQKQVAAGEVFKFGKYAVVVGFKIYESKEAPSWATNTGERLYNGIVLPAEWPPRNIDPADTRPMPVPYLDFPPAVIPIDVGRQLFVDNFLIERTDLERSFHMPEKYAGNPVLKPETPIELGLVEPEGHVKPYGHGNAGAGPKSGGCWWDPDAQVFKLWYETSWFGPIAMAVSKDGLHWDRPALDIRPGSNIVSPVDMTPDSWTVVPNWNATDPQEKWTLYVQPPGTSQPGASLTSSDGIHWNRKVKTGSTDDRSTHFYNPFRKKWVYSLRTAFPGRGRARYYYECDDFMKGASWTEADKVVWAMTDKMDPPDPYIGDAAQLYNLDAVAYESLMLGMFEIHRGPDNNVCGQRGVPKLTELNFAFSRDGFHWDRPDRRTHIPAERKDVWDRGYIQSLGNVCVISGDKMLFYYIGFRGNTAKAGSGNSMYDRSATGVAILRRDGFASLDAGSAPGFVLTRPVTFTGKQLFVNADCPGGELRAEVLDEDGKVIAPFTAENCEPVRLDSTKQIIRWKGGRDVSALAGQIVRFRFLLTGGKLYSFWVSPDDSGASNGYVAGGGPGYTGPTDAVGSAALTAGAGVGGGI